MEEYPYHKHVTKRIIGNIIKSVYLSDQETRNTFKSFFVLFKDLFKTDEEIVEAWMSLCTKNSEAELDVVRNALINCIAKGLAKVKMLEIYKANSYLINDIKLILNTVKDKIQVLTIKKIQTPEQNKFSKILGDFLENNYVLVELTLHDVGLDLPRNMQNFTNGLKHARKLKTLNIPHNNLGETCAKILAGCLQKKRISRNIRYFQQFFRT